MRKLILPFIATFLLVLSPFVVLADDRAELGIPADAIELKNTSGNRTWIMPASKGRYSLIELLPGGQMSGTAGELADLKAAYPGVDFSPLASAAAQAADTSTDKGNIDALVANRDKLVEVTPGAKEAIRRALHKGTMIELTAGTLEHMVESMGGKLDVTREELDRLLATNGNRIGLTQSDMKLLMKEAGPEGISLAQIEEMMPETRTARVRSESAGREDPDCPGLVYGAGKREICLPLGALSFADVAVSFEPGKKRSKAPFDFPGNALGEPDYRNTYSADFISLGCDGVLVVRFTDNVLVDIEGVDLYIFEVGPIVERTLLAISNNGSDWIEVGEIEGARSEVDIGPFVNKGETFSYVRLTNAGPACGGNHSGADIDAIAAVGAEIRLSLDSALLFDSGKYQLKPEALAALDELATKVDSFGPDIRVTVEGHTDSVGSDAANKQLSENRARSVWEYLATKIKVPASSVKILGYGESRPIADNETEEGRQQNRRVDLLISPRGRFAQ